MSKNAIRSLNPNRQSSSTDGVLPGRYISVGIGAPHEVDAEIVDESQVCFFVNGEELATFMCSPRDLEEMAVGFLANEGLIEGTGDIRDLHISDNNCVDIWLYDTDLELPKRKIITAGCGGGVTFDDLSGKHEPLQSDLKVEPEQLSALMRKMHLEAELYQRARGIHTAVLCDRSQILAQVEDLGRHNCLDKLRGLAILRGIETKDRILMSSGRISSEMIQKARRLQTPIVCSRTSPTSLSVAIAEAWNMTIVGYLRQKRMRIYTHPDRIMING